jgi:WD40 repeat protein
MEPTTQRLMMGASQEEGAGGNYIAVGHQVAPYFTLLDHTTPGSLSLAATYTVGGNINFGYSVAFSPDNDSIAVGPFADGGASRTFTLLDHRTPGSVSLAATYNVGTSGVTSTKFSPDGNYIAIGLENSSHLRLLQRTSFTTVSSVATALFSGGPAIVNFSPDGNYIGAAQFGTDVFTLLDHTTPGSLSVATTYTMRSGDGDGVSFSPDGNYIGVGGNSSSTLTPHFTLLDHTTPGSLSLAATAIPGNQNRVTGVDFSPDGNYIALGRSSGTGVTLLDHTTPGSLSTATTYAVSGDVHAVSFSPDGSYVALTSLNSPYFTLLDHTTPGSLSLAATYVLAGPGGGLAFSPK